MGVRTGGALFARSLTFQTGATAEKLGKQVTCIKMWARVGGGPFHLLIHDTGPFNPQLLLWMI